MPAETVPDSPATDLIQALLDSPAPPPRVSETGRVMEVADGVAIVTGLATALADELLEFASGVQGVVFDLEFGPSGCRAAGPDRTDHAG